MSFVIKFNRYSSDDRIFNLINFYIMTLVCDPSCLRCYKEDRVEKRGGKYSRRRNVLCGSVSQLYYYNNYLFVYFLLAIRIN